MSITQPTSVKRMVPTQFLLPAMAAMAVMSWLITYRIAHAGDWLPSPPNTIGIWQATDTPLDVETLRLLGGPQGLGRQYDNLFHSPFDQVRVSLIAANGFDAYHDPTVCVTGNGFLLTAKRSFPIDGPGSGVVRAMIFRHDDPDPRIGTVRILMYYWQQTRSGRTKSVPIMGNYRDILARFDTGAGAVLRGEQTVLVRIYCLISPEDTNGEQAQRNVHEVSRSIYKALKNGESAS